MRTPPFTGGRGGRCSRSSVARMEARRGGPGEREIWGEGAGGSACCIICVLYTIMLL